MMSFIGLGVAGNFTEHLEQAGEATDFVNIKADSETAPKGIFPWYVPNADSFLNINPLSDSNLSIPPGLDVQAEPELVLICDITYKGNEVVSIEPRAFTAFNDASLRIAKPKISLKKNWGPNSQGMAKHTLPIDKFEPSGVLDKFLLGSWLKRGGIWRQYGEVSEVRYYSYFYQQLLDWLIKKLNTQQDEGPLEDIANLLQIANQPELAYIAIGSTRYTDFGENTYLCDGDQIAIVLFNEDSYSQKAVEEGLNQQTLSSNDKVILLHQKVATSLS